MPTPPSKKEVLLELLEKSNVLMHLDARRDEVQVPKHLKTNPQLILQLGLNLAVPIRDLDVSDEGVKCTLSFNRSPFFCVLPYPAIFAMVAEDGRAMVWPEDVPDVVARAAEEEARRIGKLPPPKDDAAPLRPTPNVLHSKRAVARVGEDAKVRPEPKRPKATKPVPVKPQGAAAPSARPKRELPPYLRVIK